MDSCGTPAEMRRGSEEELRGGEALDHMQGSAESPLADLMEVGPSDDARATAARRGLKEAWNKRASR